MSQRKPYYITTPIYYPSDKLHIGHTYCTVATDALARYQRLKGRDVIFLTGTDEHGQKIENKAKEAGVSPKEFVDAIVDGPRGVRDLWRLMNISNDRFIRTTDEYHVKSVQRIFRRMYEKGDIYLGSYKGKYCTPCESFWTESQLKDGCCPDCGRPVTDAEEEAYFFRLSKYADRIRDLLENTDFLQPRSRVNEMVKNFLDPGLEDLCVSRTSFQWGIPVDFDAKHVVYVWLDALANYITCIGYDCGGDSSALFKKLWPADLHLIGKDIIRFHTIYWPIFLMSLDLPLPKTVFGHPWLLQQGDKMSKSKGNVMYADDLCELFGVDAVRYFVLHEMPFDNDGSITWDVLVERLNADLANTLGNLLNRTVAMSNKYFAGAVKRTGAAEPVDDELKAVASGTAARVVKCTDDYRIADALSELFNLFRRCNKYIDETTPWVLAKDPEKADRLSEVLYNLIESISIGANLLAPFLPATAERILAQISAEPRTLESLSAFGLYPADGNKVAEQPEILFARLDPKAVTEQVEALAAKYAAPAEPEAPALPPIKDEITYDDFQKLDLRLAKVTACEEVKRSKKLLKLTVSLGNEERTVVSGIKNWYKPEDLVGKTVVLVANLKPVTLCGVESHGMILAASDPEDKELAFLSPVRDLPAGWVVR